jgi:hypothetical protein
MANGEQRGTAAEQQATTRILGESGLEKRGGYSAMEPPKPLPKVQSGPAAGGASTSSQQGQAPAGGSQGQSGAS